MKIKKLIGVLALFILAVPTVVFASGSGDKIESGETINEDLTLFNDTTIEEGATVNGDVAVWGGKLELDGIINGDLIVLGGDVELDGTVSGNVAVIGGDLDIASDAIINGNCVLLGGSIDDSHSCFNPVSSEFSLDALQEFATLGESPHPPAKPFVVEQNRVGGIFAAAVSMAFTAIVAGVIAGLATSLIPDRMYQVRSAVKYSPYAAGSIGILTAIAGSSFLILTSIIWLPLLAVLSVICGLGVFLGFAGIFYIGVISAISWTSVGTLVVERFSSRMNEPLVAGIGTGLLTLVLGILGSTLPGIAGFLIFVLFCVGLGGVVLTKLGKQPYPVQPNFINDIKIDQVMSTLPPE